MLRLLANDFKSTFYDHVRFLIIFALGYYFGTFTRVKGFLVQTVIKLGFQTLSKVVVPIKMPKKVNFFFIFACVGQSLDLIFYDFDRDRYDNGFRSYAHRIRRPKTLIGYNFVISKSAP